MVGLFVLIGMIILFIVLGTYLMQGRGAFLIAGYNTMPQEEKDQYDTLALCKFMGKMMYALSLSMVPFVFGALYQVDWPFWVGTVLIFACTIFMVAYMNTGQRFKKLGDEEKRI